MSRVSIVGGMSYNCLGMSWKLSHNSKQIISFQNYDPDQTMTISKRQLFALLKVVAMSCPHNPNHPDNRNSNISNWLSGFDENKSKDDDYFLTIQESSDQKEDLTHQN